MKEYDKVVLVTGGAGFIGSCFLRMYVNTYSNWYFINLDALTYAGNLNNVELIQDSDNYVFVKGNICDSHLIESLFEKYPINTVLNFAAESHVDNSIVSPTEFLVTNIIGTQVLMEVAKKFWSERNSFDDSRFIQISTDEVYGSLKSDSLSSLESDILLPNSPYSASKASAELVCRSYFTTYNFPVIVTRSSNNFGPYQNKEKLIPKTITNALNGLTIPLYGDGNNIRDWIYVEDNCSAILHVILKGLVGEIYNIASHNEISNIRIVKMIINSLNQNLNIIKFVTDRLGHDFRYSLNTHKISNLGWRPRFDLSSGIDLTIAHYVSASESNEK
jgi:dTDP-glucose 4,6-dehydratase